MPRHAMITVRRQIGAGGWLKVERRLADCGGETLSRLVADEAVARTRSAGGETTWLNRDDTTVSAEESGSPNAKAAFT